MKKIVSILVTAIVMLSMVSCGNRSAKNVEPTEEVVEVVDSVAVDSLATENVVAE